MLDLLELDKLDRINLKDKEEGGYKKSKENINRSKILEVG